MTHRERLIEATTRARETIFAILALLLFVGSLPVADAAISTNYIPSYDNTRSAAYPNGDKPQGGTCPPSTYTGLNLGGGGGTICDNGSGDLLFTVTGLNSIDDARIIYKDGGGGEVQVEGKILDDYAGSSQVNAAVGGGIRESTSVTSWVAQMKSLQSGTNAIQGQYGPADAPTSVNCSASGTTRPIWWYVTFYPTNNEVKGFTSVDNGATKQECFSTPRAMSNDLAYFLGGSKSATVSLTATIEDFSLKTEIDAYSETPAGGGAPTLVSAIPDQTGTEGTAYSLTFSSYFSGATSHSLGSAFPGALTETSDGVLGGTPNSTDVSSSPYSRDLCATNASGTTCDSVSFTFDPAPSSGSVFLIPDVGNTTESTFNCNNASTGANGASWASIRTSGTASTPGAGDVLRWETGRRGPTEMINCGGSAASDLTYVPHTGQVTISGGSGQWAWRHNTTNFITVSGASWTGKPAGRCGVSEDGLRTLGTTQCGFVVTGHAATHPQDYLKIYGDSSDYHFEDIEVAGVGQCAAGGGHALGNNDHSIEWHDFPDGADAGTAPDRLRENISFKHMYMHDTGSCGSSTGGGSYLGGNSWQDDVPGKNWEYAYNFLEDIGGSSVQFKNVLFGTNSMHHNYFRNIGGPGALPGISAMQGKNIANFSVYANEATDVMGFCISFSGETPQADAPTDLGYLHVYGNVLSNCGNGGTAFANDNDGIKVANGSIKYSESIQVDFNTVVTTVGSSIKIGTFDTGSATPVARNNIGIDYGGTEANAITGGTETNNRTSGTIGAQNFEDSTSLNFRLTSTSPARNGGTSAGCRATDFEDESRPQENICDQGVDEYVP